MLNLVVLMDKSDHPWDISLKAANMCFNRFCIDEEAACEISGVYYLKTSSDVTIYDDDIAGEVKEEGKDY